MFRPFPLVNNGHLDLCRFIFPSLCHQVCGSDQKWLRARSAVLYLSKQPGGPHHIPGSEITPLPRCFRENAPLSKRQSGRKLAETV